MLKIHQLDAGLTALTSGFKKRLAIQLAFAAFFNFAGFAFGGNDNFKIHAYHLLSIRC